MPLAEACEKITDGTHHSPPIQPAGIPYVTAKHIKADGPDFFSDPWFVSENDHREIFSRCDPRPGDVLYIKDGATTGIAAVNRYAFEFSMLSSVALLRPRAAVLTPEFLCHWLNAPLVKRRILGGMAGVAIRRLTLEKINAIRVPFPPVPEQQRIAAILDKADALRAKRRAALAQLDTLTQSIFLDMFGDPAKVLTKWPITKLGNQLDFLTSGSRGWAQYYADSGDLFLRIQNVRHDELLLEDIAYVNAPNTAEAKRTQVEPGDVLFSITADLGRTAVVPEGIGKAYINQHLSILRTKQLVPRFLSAYFASPVGQRQVVERNRHGVKAGLNFDDIRSFIVPLPPMELQHEFSRRVKAVEKLRTEQRAYRTKLDSLFISLQHRAFRGEL